MYDQTVLKEVEKMNSSETYWNHFYKDHAIDQESTFCHFVRGQMPEGIAVLDIGCGTARDSFSFSRNGYQVFALDRSDTVIQLNREKLSQLVSDDHQLSFAQIDLANPAEFSEYLAEVFSALEINQRPVMIYLRFLLHAIDEASEDAMFDMLTKFLRAEDRIAMEFRTTEDELLGKTYSNHYRRFLNPESLLQRLAERFDFQKDYFFKGTGLSPYKDEDPFLARILLKKI